MCCGDKAFTSLTVSRLLVLGIEDEGMTSLAYHSEMVFCAPFYMIVPCPIEIESREYLCRKVLTLPTCAGSLGLQGRGRGPSKQFS